jgi:hypothetical protein
VSYVLLVSNSNSQAQVFGTPTGQAYTTEESAVRASKRFRRKFPRLDVLVMPVSEIPTGALVGS